jgi:2-polyprenyl-3-methyl-5-hydroxy-6-metoxy-1,4-benzoquinol methylase
MIKCLNCDDSISKPFFPYKTFFNKKKFRYYFCKKCCLVSIYPTVSADDIKLMYSRNKYHKEWYTVNKDNPQNYNDSKKYLSKFLTKKKTILDFGCGTASLLNLISNEHERWGVDLDEELIKENRQKNKSIFFYNVNDFENFSLYNHFDIIILTDVLEHVVSPKKFLEKMKKYLKKSGKIFVEGPLEINFSIVNFVSIFYFRFFKKNFNEFIPYHQFFSNHKSQKKMFLSSSFRIIDFKTYDNGWPYLNSKNLLKKVIGLISIITGKTLISCFNYGNRFRSIITKK